MPNHLFLDAHSSAFGSPTGVSFCSSYPLYVFTVSVFSTALLASTGFSKDQASGQEFLQFMKDLTVNNSDIIPASIR